MHAGARSARHATAGSALPERPPVEFCVVKVSLLVQRLESWVSRKVFGRSPCLAAWARPLLGVSRPCYDGGLARERRRSTKGWFITPFYIIRRLRSEEVSLRLSYMYECSTYIRVHTCHVGLSRLLIDRIYCVYIVVKLKLPFSIIII